MKMRIGVLLLLLAGLMVLGCQKSETSGPSDKTDQAEQPAATPPAGESAEATTTAPSAKSLSPMKAQTTALDAEHLDKAQKMINEGVAFLLTQQDDDGGWSMNGAMTPAVTALVLQALVQHPDFSAESPVLAKGYDVLLGYQQDNGGIYDPEQGRENYCTAIAVSALAAADHPKFKEPMAEAVDYLLGLQIIPGQKTQSGDDITPEHPFVGGVSYGKHGRPDLSNVGMWVQALHDAGVDPNHEAMQRALQFVTRTQNLSETNPLEWAQDGTNDGGFIYAPAKKDGTSSESKAGETRSYGSMTYVGFKSLLYAGLSKNDPRVKAAYSWIRQYWRLDSNPNMPNEQSQQGLYYYYHAFAKALRAWGEDQIPAVGSDETHNWRQELIDALAKRQRDNGAWWNDEPRWAESSPTYATTLSVLALEEAMKK